MVLAGDEDSGAVGAVSGVGLRSRCRGGVSGSGFELARSGGAMGCGAGGAIAADAGGPGAGSSRSCALSAGDVDGCSGASASKRTSASSAKSASSAPVGSDHGSLLQGASSRRPATALLVLHRDQEMIGSGLARSEHRLDHHTVRCRGVGRHDEGLLGSAE